MDTDKLRAAKDAANIGTSGWKSAEFRGKVVKKIVDTVVENAPRTWSHSSSDIMKFAERFEEKVHASATDEADYIAKITRKIRTIKASAQSSASKPLPLNSSGPSEVLSAPGAQERAASVDWQELIYQRVQMIRSTYLTKLNMLYLHVCNKLQQCDSAPQQMKTTDIEKHKFVKRLLEEIFTHLKVTKSQITPDFKERLDKVEKHIHSILRPKNDSSHHQGQHSADVHSMQQAVPSHSRVSQEEVSGKKPTLQVMSQQSSHLTKQTPQQNKMHLQSAKLVLNSEQVKSVKLMQQVAKESSSSQKQQNQLSLIKGVTSKDSFENLPISSCGNAVQHKINSALKSNACGNLNEISHNPTVDPNGTSASIQHLVKVLDSMSPEALSQSISEIGQVVRFSDISSAPFDGPKHEIGSNLVVDLNADLQETYLNSHDFEPRERKMRRHINAIPLYTSTMWSRTSDSFKPLTDADKSDLNSVTSQVKWPTSKEKCALLEEIKDVNKILIDTEVVINEEDTIPSAARGTAEHGEGLIAKCFFSAVTVNPNLRSQFASNQKSIIKPLWLLVPTSYPFCSPILLDEMPSEFRDLDDLSEKTKSKLRFSLRSLNQPWSVGKIAILWEHCAREAICDYAQRNGGGTFSSQNGGWETCPQ